MDVCCYATSKQNTPDACRLTDMSSSYSANQYENAFKSQRLQNWCEPKPFKEQRPTAKVGHTTVIVNDRGHLLPRLKQKGSAWSDFKGTWDLPARIPAQHICRTARSVEGLNRLKSWGFVAQHPDKSHRGSKNIDVKENVGEQIQEAVQVDNAVQSFTPPAEAQSASQGSPITGDDRRVNQDLSDIPGSLAHLTENKQPTAADEVNFETCQ